MSSKPKNIGQIFDWHAEKQKQTTIYLDRPLDIDRDRLLTHYDAESLAALVREVSASLYAAGARSGDRIAVVKENHFDLIVFAAAAARIGAVAALISGANRPEHQRAMLSRIEPALSVVSSSVLNRAASEAVALAGHGKLLVIQDDETLPRDGEYIPFEQLQNSPIPSTNCRGDDEAMFITHTSGTTGIPKLVVHSARSNHYGSRLELTRLPLIVNKRDDTSLVSVSFAHSRCLAWIGAQLKWAPKKIVVVSRPDPATIRNMFSQHRPTTVESTPAIYQRWTPVVLAEPELFSQVRMYLNTFDLIHPSTVRAFLGASRRRFPVWAHSWGQSEVGPIAGTIYTRGMLKRVGAATTSTIGWSFPGYMRTKVIDPASGRRRLFGRVGAILCRSRSRCIDYLGETDRHEFKSAGSWWHTGDLGYKDALARIHFVDRAVDEIPGISGTEIESVLLDRIPDATEVVVLGVTGRLPIPVVCIDGANLDQDEWSTAIRGLPELADPVFMTWDELPRTSTLKVRRLELRQRLVGTEHGEGVSKWT